MSKSLPQPTNVRFRQCSLSSTLYRLSQLPFVSGFHESMTPAFLGLNDSTVLDIGCGPKLASPWPNGTLVGIDISSDFSRSYDSQAHFSGTTCEVSSIVASATHLPFTNGSFSQCRSVGLFHHLSDSQVILALREADRVLDDGGKMILVDNIWPSSTIKNPCAWLIRRLDRGVWIRSEAHIKELFVGVCGYITDWQIIKYSFFGLEAVIASGTKKSC